MPLVIRPPQHLQIRGPARGSPNPRARMLAPPGSIAVQGMQGLGDNLHQRAIIRQLMQQGMVFLETPWPSVYHDLVAAGLHLAPRTSTLRTQAKNVAREISSYTDQTLPRGARQIRVWYTGEQVRQYGSIFAAMVHSTGCSMEEADFRLPVPDRWLRQIDERIAQWHPTKPIMLYRPLVERTEWQGCAGRNPDFDAYRSLFLAIRDRFFVVSVADLVPGKEWIAGHYVLPDVALHQGELPFEQLAALAARSGLVFASAGFAPLLAQAVGTPNICVFGGHESSMTIKDGAKFAPTLGIDPIEPCNCFDHYHKHKKAIDIPAATARIIQFVEQQCCALP